VLLDLAPLLAEEETSVSPAAAEQALTGATHVPLEWSLGTDPTDPDEESALAVFLALAL
jgi:hypothetical protein